MPFSCYWLPVRPHSIAGVPGFAGAPEGIRTPNLLIRSQVLYPLSYGRLRADVRVYRLQIERQTGLSDPRSGPDEQVAEAPGFEPWMGLRPKPH